MASKVVVAGGDHLIQVDSEIGLAALDVGKDFKTYGLDRFHLHVGIAFGVSVQKCRKHAVDQMRGGGHLEQTAVSAPDLLRLVC
jgi:hypothetical protein